MKSTLKHWEKVIKFKCIIFYYDYIESIISDRLDVERVQYLAGIKTLDQCKNMDKYNKAKKYFKASKFSIPIDTRVVKSSQLTDEEIRFLFTPKAIHEQEAFPVVNDTNLKSTNKIKSDEKPIATTDKVDK
jgi:hypothetical protein